MPNQITTTADGSHTLYVPELDEHYHSTHGAVQESQHVFIEMGLKVLPALNRPLRIFEMGFGTGLNALLTAAEAHTSIEFVSAEKYPVSAEAAAGLNYANAVSYPNAVVLFEAMHCCAWNEPVALTDSFALHKIEGDVRTIDLPGLFDCVYFDAFGPRVQPDLWSEAVFEKLFAAMHPRGILVTYCAQGQMKRNLKAAGFTIERLPGPPGKREMTRATKPKA